MQEIATPIRPGDFVNSRSAILEWTEELVALDRLKLSNVEPFEWGFALRLNASQRFHKWWFDRSDTEHLFLLEARELDRYGTHLVVTHKIASSPAYAYAAICPWNDLPRAAEHLRKSCIGPKLWETYGPASLAVYVDTIVRALPIPEQSLNSNQLPSHCATKWGQLLRIDPAGVERTLDYLTVERPADCSVPLLVNLGANVFAVFAFGPSAGEPLRIGLCDHWGDDLALKDAARWLKSLPRNRKEISFS
jgi:hypothetical protein